MKVSIELEPETGQLAHIRRLVSNWAEAVRADQDSLSLIATELVTNAFAAAPDQGPVVVWLEEASGEAQVSVMDPGPGLDRRDFSLPAPSSVRGRGLAIVDRLADRLEIHRTDEGTVVTAATRAACCH